MQLLTKVILQFEHHMYISFGVSKQSYRELQEILAGIGQGNVLSGNIYHNTSCLMIKIPEKKRLGIKIKLPISIKEEQQVSVAFIDNTDFLL